MIQTHPPLEQRLRANAQLLNKAPVAEAKSNPKAIVKVSDTCGEFGVQGMFDSKTQHAMASQNAN